MRVLSNSHLTLTAHSNMLPAAQRHEIDQINMRDWWGNANECWDEEQKFVRTQKPSWLKQCWQCTNTHTHTHLGLQQSEVSEPVRGLWLDVVPEQAGQKRCLSPLIKWFKIPCSPDSFHRRPKCTHFKKAQQECQGLLTWMGWRGAGKPSSWRRTRV